MAFLVGRARPAWGQTSLQMLLSDRVCRQPRTGWAIALWRRSAAGCEGQIEGQGLLQVSNLGRVRSTTGRVSPGRLNGSVYLVADLPSTSGRRSVLVHRIVAFTFLKLPSDRSQHIVNHIDGVKVNNRSSNLEFVSLAENTRHSFESGLQSRTSNRPVKARLQGGPWKRYPSVVAAAKELDVPQRTLYELLRNQQTGADIETGLEIACDREEVSEVLQGEVWEPALDPASGEVLGLWQVSSHGRLRKPNGTIVLGTSSFAGYRSVVVEHCGKKKYLKVHRIVARTFLGQIPKEQPSVIHLDRVLDNNCVQNLKYADRSEIMQDAYKHPVANITSRPPIRGRAVAVRSRLGDSAWRYFETVKEAAIALDRSSSFLSKCCRGRAKLTGYECKYRDELVSSPGRQSQTEIWKDLDVAAYFDWAAGTKNLCQEGACDTTRSFQHHVCPLVVSTQFAIHLAHFRLSIQD